jgi:hypothetical protein
MGGEMMEKTEMMKRYEAERGGIMPCGMEIQGGFIYSKEYVAWLEAQLTWRPVSERPEKDGWYLCKVLYVNDTIGEETVHFDGERFVFSNVVKWLPIPPAPEGE